MSNVAISCFGRASTASPRSQASMCCAAFLPWPTAVVTVRVERHHVAAGKDAGAAGLHVGPDDDGAVLLERDAGDVLEERRCRCPGRARESANRPRASRTRRSAAGSRFSSSRITSTVSVVPSISLIVRSQWILTPSSMRLVGLEVVRGHLLARAAVDDERLGAEPSRRARGVHRGVAAAVDRDAAADLRRRRRVSTLLQELQRVVDLAGVACRDVLALAQVRADGEEHRVESAGRPSRP